MRASAIIDRGRIALVRHVLAIQKNGKSVAVEIRRGNRLAHNYLQRACSPDLSDNARSYTARLDLHRNQKVFRKAIVPHKRGLEFPRGGYRRKWDPDRNENRLACSCDRMINGRLHVPILCNQDFPKQFYLQACLSSLVNRTGGRSSCRCHSRTDR